MMTARRSLATLLIALFSLSPALAQDSKSLAPQTTSLTITASASQGRVRFTAPSQVVQMHLEIYSEAGEKLFDTVQAGSVMDYLTMDKAGEQLPDAAYLCVVTVKTVSGKLSQKVGTLVMQEQQVSVRLRPAQLSAAQAQAVGPVEENSALTVLAEGDAPSATVIAHDGQNGQVTSTQGALTFRTGDVFSGTEQEGMRLTEAGNLGIGTETPEVRLDVNGMIRAREGFQFSDGSVLNLSPKGGLRVTLPSGKTAAVNLAPNAVEGTANRIPKFAPDGTSLLDSAIYQDPNNGNIGIGTTTPLHPFVVRKNGATLGVHSIGELFVDRDDRTRSASLTVGTAGTLKWIFGMPFQSDGFQVYDLTNNVSRFFVDPTNGNIGIGTTTPQSRLVVAPGGSGGQIQFSAPSTETGMTISGNASNSRADVRFDGATLKLVAAGGGGVPLSTNGIVIDTQGLVGIGTTTPQAKLTVNAGGSGGEVRFSAPGGESGMSIVGTNRADVRFDGQTLKLLAGPGTGAIASTNGININGLGNVGIGTTTPALLSGSSGKLVSISDSLNPGIALTNTSARQFFLYSAGNPGSFRVFDATSNADRFTIDNVGNAKQERGSNGLVKAMVYADGNGNMIRCYNSQLPDGGASLPPSGGNGCGISVVHRTGGVPSSEGVNDVVFNYRVNDRFVSLTPDYHRIAVSFEFFENSPNTVRVITYLTDIDAVGSERNNAFMLILY